MFLKEVQRTQSKPQVNSNKEAVCNRYAGDLASTEALNIKTQEADRDWNQIKLGGCVHFQDSALILWGCYV